MLSIWGPISEFVWRLLHFSEFMRCIQLWYRKWKYLLVVSRQWKLSFRIRIEAWKRTHHFINLWPESLLYIRSGLLRKNLGKLNRWWFYPLIFTNQLKLCKKWSICFLKHLFYSSSSQISIIQLKKMIVRMTRN